MLPIYKGGEKFDNAYNRQLKQCSFDDFKEATLYKVFCMTSTILCAVSVYNACKVIAL